DIRVEEVDYKNREKAKKNRNRSSKIELNNADKAEVDSGIESQALTYDQRPVKTVENGHMKVKVEPINARSLENKDKEKNISENLRLTYHYKDKKKTLADLKSDSNEAYKCSKTKDLEDLKDNYPENYDMKFAKETLSNESRL
ncbi:9771_t:CDS:2, partial [Gigaspora margarita]